MSFYELSAKTIDGKDFSFSQLKNKTVMIVNVASECGLTHQYEMLERIFEKYSAQNFLILGFPANNFGAQEPGSNEQIQQFCRSKFSIKFQMMEKVSAKGDDIHPVFKFLTDNKQEAINPNGDAFEKDIAEFGFPRANKRDILWNFEKFLINKKGEITHRFNPDIKPDDKIVIAAIEENL